MSKPILSILLPAIRPHNWERLYDSIVENIGDYPFELILVGPYQLPQSLEKHRNIKTIRDFGCPSRCMNIAASVAEGKYVTWSADDGVHLNNGFEKALDILENDPEKEKTVVVTKYLEANDNIQPDDYYLLNKAYPYSQYNGDHWLIFNIAFMHTKFYKELGGCDASLEVGCMTLADLTCRAYKAGANVTGFLREPTAKFDWFPADTGDHKPIFEAQTQHDWTLYQVYQADINRNIRLDFDNWKLADTIWTRRF